jgi:hypothetical protein
MGKFSSPLWAAETSLEQDLKNRKKNMRTVIVAVNKELLKSKIKATGNRRIYSR